MRKIFSKITAFLLALLVLLSSSFIVIDEHYCCGKLENFSFFGKAEVCDMAMPTCESNNLNKVISEDSCCSSDQKVKEASIFKTTPIININEKQIDIIAYSIPYFLNNLAISAKQSSHFKNYVPPLITEDILVFVQCFRI